MVDPVALAALAISAIVAYVAEFRGPNMKMELLRAPTDWHVNPGRPAVGKPGGGFFLTGVDEAFTLLVVGKCPGRVWNEGPKGGAVWDLRLETDLPAPWSAKFGLDLSDPYTLSGKENAGLHAQVEFFCPRDDLPASVKWLESTQSPILVRLNYSGLKSLGRTKREHSDVLIQPADLAAKIRSWAVGAAFSLETARPF